MHRANNHTLFQTFSWNQAAARTFADREAPFVSFAEDDNGMALVPAALVSGTYVTLLGERLFDYRNVLSTGDPAVLACAWTPIAELGLPLSVTAVRESSLEPWEVFGASSFCSAPRVRVGEASAEDMEAQHRKLGRFSRRLRKQGIELRKHDGSASELVRFIYRQKAAQFRGKADNIFADEQRVNFMVAICATEPEACEILTFERASDVIAAIVMFRDRHVRRFYTTWFDSAWAKGSPGQVMVYEATLNALREGFDCDYMTGEQPHKTRLATSREQLYRVNLDAEAWPQVLERMRETARQAA